MGSGVYGFGPLFKVSPTVRNHGIQAGKGGANPYYRRCQTVGGSEPTAIVAAERKHGYSFARGLAGGSCPAPCVVQGDYQLKGVTSR